MAVIGRYYCYRMEYDKKDETEEKKRVVSNVRLIGAREEEDQTIRKILEHRK